jgi:hypothetical protein
MKLYRKDLCAATVLALALWAPTGLRADVTIRYRSEVTLPAALQPVAEKLLKPAQAGAEISVRMKGNKAYTTSGDWIQIFDFVKQEVTLINPAHKTFASLPVSRLSDEMAGALPQVTPEQMQDAQKAMASIKTNVESKMTGNTAEIEGIQAEEREVTLTMDLPLPAAMNQGGPSVRLVMHIWTPKKEEVLRVAAIRELTGYQNWQRYVMNPTGMLDKLFGKMGMPNTMGPMFEEVYKNSSVILRTRMEIYMPFLAVLAKRMGGQDETLPAIDPDAPVMEMNQEITELSSAPVDAALLEIPAGFTAVGADDLVKGLLQAQAAAAGIAPK